MPKAIDNKETEGGSNTEQRPGDARSTLGSLFGLGGGSSQSRDTSGGSSTGSGYQSASNSNESNTFRGPPGGWTDLD